MLEFSKAYLKSLLFLILMLITLPSFANDGSYRQGSGNHLIPVNETDISLKKEILTIKRGEYKFNVSVYYELFNPGEEKEIIVGFEADNSSYPGSVYPNKGEHPYISSFKINVNDKDLKYKMSYLLNNESLSAEKKAISLPNLKKYIKKDIESASFTYIYSFKVVFKKGINIIKHNYEFSVYSDLGAHYLFDYKLTPATRWANKQIDDFTLKLDLGNYEGIKISLLNDDTKKYWSFSGSGHYGRTDNSQNENQYEDVFIEHGELVFHKENFIPSDELSFSCPQFFNVPDDGENDGENLPYSLSASKSTNEASNSDGKFEPFQNDVIKNLQLARDGYVFPDKRLYNYFMKFTNWYRPNPAYQPKSK